MSSVYELALPFAKTYKFCTQIPEMEGNVQEILSRKSRDEQLGRSKWPLITSRHA